MSVSYKKGDVVGFSNHNLVVEVVKSIKNRTGKRRTYLIFSCPVCSKDSEMWPQGSIKCLPYEVKTGRPPCGCKSSVKYTERQNILRVKRKCEILNYEFLGWSTTYSTIHKTGFRVFDRILKEFNTFGSIVVFLSGKGLSQSRQNIDLGKRDQVLDKDALIKGFSSSGNYIEGTKFIPITSRLSGYWILMCPNCSCDEFVENNVCGGKFKIYKGDIDKGIKPCRCSDGYRWKENQREYQIKKVLKEIDAEWIGWVSDYKNRSSKFKWKCSNGHETEKSVLTFLQGSRCRICFDEDRCYGYYPKRKYNNDYLCLIRMHGVGEVFYKIGRSFNVNARVSSFARSYKCAIVSTFPANHDRVYMLEQCLHSLCKDEHYNPLIKFKGSVNECFTPEILNHPEIISIFNLKDSTNDK